MRKKNIFILIILLGIVFAAVMVYAGTIYMASQLSMPMSHYRSLDPTRIGINASTNYWNNATDVITIVNMTFPADNTCYTAYIIQPGGTVLASAAINLTTDTAIFNYTIHPGRVYYFMTDSNGSSCVVYDNTTPSWPRTNTFINFTNSCYFQNCTGVLTAQGFGPISIGLTNTTEVTYTIAGNIKYNNSNFNNYVNITVIDPELNTVAYSTVTNSSGYYSVTSTFTLGKIYLVQGYFKNDTAYLTTKPKFVNITTED
jgi:hypothetical protein